MKKSLSFILFAELLLSACIPVADRVFTNAKVYSISLDGQVTHAEAVAVADGKILFVGDGDEAAKYIGKGTEVTDCQGNTLMPAFNDGHMHFTISVRRFGVADLNFTPAADATVEEVVEEIQRRVKEFAQVHPSDPVIHRSDN